MKKEESREKGVMTRAQNYKGKSNTNSSMNAKGNQTSLNAGVNQTSTNPKGNQTINPTKLDMMLGKTITGPKITTIKK